MFSSPRNPNKVPGCVVGPKGLPKSPGDLNKESLGPDSPAVRK